MDVLRERPLMKQRKIKRVDDERKEFCEPLVQFNTRDKEAAPTDQHCNAIIKTMLANKSIANFTEGAYQTGGALFIML